MPAPSAAQQKAYVSEVVQVTQADSKTAAKLLAKSNWNTSVAINAYVDILSLVDDLLWRNGIAVERSPRSEEWIMCCDYSTRACKATRPLTLFLTQLLQQPVQHCLKSYPQSSRPDLRQVPHKPHRVAQRARHRGHWQPTHNSQHRTRQLRRPLLLRIHKVSSTGRDPSRRLRLRTFPRSKLRHTRKDHPTRLKSVALSTRHDGAVQGRLQPHIHTPYRGPQKGYRSRAGGGFLADLDRLQDGLCVGDEERYRLLASVAGVPERQVVKGYQS
jgi:hypothetical protein